MNRYGLSTEKTSTIKLLLKQVKHTRTKIGKANRAILQRELKIRKKRR
jgi:hypothetical protein